MGSSKPPSPPATHGDIDPAAERQARLGAALRANLKRRKAQVRQRTSTDDNNYKKTKEF